MHVLTRPSSTAAVTSGILPPAPPAAGVATAAGQLVWIRLTWVDPVKALVVTKAPPRTAPAGRSPIGVLRFIPGVVLGGCAAHRSWPGNKRDQTP